MPRDFVVDPNRPPLTYEDLGTYTAPDSDWAVRVQTRATGRPIYSYEFGKIREGKFLRYIAAGVTTYGGTVNVPELDIAVLLTIMPACYAAVRADAQRREREHQMQRPVHRDEGGEGGGGYNRPDARPDTRPDANAQRRTGKPDRQQEKGRTGKPSRRGEDSRDY